jgi:outer membrane protein
MKKSLFLITAMCFLCISMLNAQFNKGTILLGLSTSSNNLYSMYTGGSSNFFHLGFTTMTSKSNTSSSSEKIRTFNLSPRVGYFIVKNLAAGLGINFSLLSMGTGNNKETSTLSGIGPFIRYYLPLKKIAPFAEVEGSFGSSVYKYTSSTDKSSISSFMGGIGFAVPIGNKFAFDVLGGYVSTTLKAKQNNLDNERDILGTLAIKVGFHLYLGANQ